MSFMIKLIIAAFAACICQTNFVDYIRIAGVAPDMLIVFLVLLTSYTGAYGGFCTGALISMLYDASVGYVLAINMVAYTFIGWAAPMMRIVLNKKLKKLKHKSYLVMMLICFFLTLMREVLYIGYLFLIGSEQSMVTLVRAVLCCAYSALMILPTSLLVRKIMTLRFSLKRAYSDFKDDSSATETDV